MKIRDTLCQTSTNLMDRVKVFFIAIEFDAVIVDALGHLLVLAHETGEEDRQTNDLSHVEYFVRCLSNRYVQLTDLNGLNEKNGGEETADQRCQPFLYLDITEFDTAYDNEKRRDGDQYDRQAVGNVQTPPWEQPR